MVSSKDEAAFAQAVGSETFAVLPSGERVIRFVCSWATQQDDVDQLLEFAASRRRG